MRKQGERPTVLDLLYIHYRKVIFLVMYLPALIVSFTTSVIIQAGPSDLNILSNLSLILMIIIGLLSLLRFDFLSEVLLYITLSVFSLLIAYIWGVSSPLAILLFLLSCKLGSQIFRFLLSSIFNTLLLSIFLIVLLGQRGGIFEISPFPPSALHAWDLLIISVLIITFITVHWVGAVARLKRIEKISEMEDNLQKIRYYLESELSLHTKKNLELDSVSGEEYLEDRFIKMNLIYHYGLLASSLAHNMANPLMLIMNRIRAVEFDKKDEVVSAIEDISESMRSIGMSVNDGSKKERFTVQECLFDATSSTQWRVDLYGIHLRIKGGSSNLVVQGSYTRFRSILLNLIINAIESSALSIKRDVAIEILKRGEYGYIIIQNSGKKIPKAFVKKVFGLFSTSKKGGSGLGLFVSREDARHIFNGNVSLIKNEKDNIQFEFKFELAG